MNIMILLYIIMIEEILLLIRVIIIIMILVRLCVGKMFVIFVIILKTMLAFLSRFNVLTEIILVIVNINIF